MFQSHKNTFFYFFGFVSVDRAGYKHCRQLLLSMFVLAQEHVMIAVLTEFVGSTTSRTPISTDQVFIMLHGIQCCIVTK